MAKDPAFLFYYQDFIVGTLFMSNEETGVYIKTLCHLADKGTITDVQIVMLCEKNTDMALTIMDKLEIITEGVYCSKRLSIEVDKRKAFAESRRKNREGKKKKKADKICKTYDTHMEDENENINRVKDRELIFKKEVLELKQFPQAILYEFLEYWTEQNKSGTKMRFEMERTWNLKRRLSRWANNNFGKSDKKTYSPGKKQSANVERIMNVDYDNPKFKSKRIKPEKS